MNKRARERDLERNVVIVGFNLGDLLGHFIRVFRLEKMYANAIIE